MTRAYDPIVALIVALAIVAPRASFAADDNAPSDSRKITSGGIGSGGNTVTCNFGMPPEQLKAAIEAAVNGHLIDRIVQISKTLGVTEDAAEKLLKIVGEDPNIAEDKLAEALSKVAADYQRLQAQVAALNPDNSTAKALVERAKPEIDAGHFQRARELLHQAAQAQVEAAQGARKLRDLAQAAADAQMLGGASSTAAEGGVALTERHYGEAAELFGQAADDVPSGHASEQGGYLMRQEDALYWQGHELGDNAALSSAIEVCKRALADYPRERVPLDWAGAQNNLGNALMELGEREGATEKLEGAVVAFRAALGELTRERLPLRWARAQQNLGSALSELGQRENDIVKLEEAVAAYRAALEEEPRERVPLDWATAQNNLGIALSRLGERESGTARLEEAVAAYRLALEERTRVRTPLAWATTQNNLGAALQTLGMRESGTAHLEEAVAAYHAALEERTHERVPLAWAEAQLGLGNTLLRLGDRQSNSERLEQAVVAYRAALQEATRERVPLEWAATRTNLGEALLELGQLKNDVQKLQEGVIAYRAALEDEGDRSDWATARNNLGNALLALGMREVGSAGDPRPAHGQVRGAAPFPSPGGRGDYRIALRASSAPAASAASLA